MAFVSELERMASKYQAQRRASLPGPGEDALVHTNDDRGSERLLSASSACLT